MSLHTHACCVLYLRCPAAERWNGAFVGLDGCGRIHDSHGGYSKEVCVFFGFALGGLRGIVHVFFFLTGRRMLGKISKGGWGGGIPCALSNGIVARAGFSRCYQIARNA